MYSKYLDQKIDERCFIIGDPQFGSPLLFKHVAARRVFGSIGKLHKTLVTNWNRAVGKDDTVICLGDFSQNLKSRIRSLELIEKYSRQLNGHKILIRGNHDVEKTQFYYDYGWNAVVEFPLLILDQETRWLNPPSASAGCIIKDISGQRIMFSHFALFEDEQLDSRYLLEKAYLRELFDEHQCDINIHGHNHDRPVNSEKCYSACVEHTYFSPVRLEDFMVEQKLSDERVLA